MKLRDALLAQAPSLALQRAAADEIARLDALLAQKQAALDWAIQQIQGYERTPPTGERIKPTS